MPLIGRENVDKAIVELTKQTNNNLREIYFHGLSKMMIGTPVDTGRARSNWFLTTGIPSNSTTPSKSRKENIDLPKNILGKKIYFTNNLPYIGALEYGGYPSPVKNGTWNKKRGSFEIRSISGFSDQAPKGWIRIELIKMRNKIKAL